MGPPAPPPPAQVSWHQTAAQPKTFDLFLRTPMVAATSSGYSKNQMWPAVGVVPWLVWADSVPQQQLAMLARHWGVLAALGITGPPARERWQQGGFLASPSVPDAPQQGLGSEEDDEEEEEGGQGEGRSADGDSDEEEEKDSSSDGDSDEEEGEEEMGQGEEEVDDWE
jgi:hypothetical protein